MFARFDENPAMTLEEIKETKRYGRTDGSTDGQRENRIPTTNKVCGGYKYRNYKTYEKKTIKAEDNFSAYFAAFYKYTGNAQNISEQNCPWSQYPS